jgi:hypothetical protein
MHDYKPKEESIYHKKKCGYFEGKTLGFKQSEELK